MVAKRVGDKRANPKQVGLFLNTAVAGKAVFLRVRAELSLVPSRQLPGDGRLHQRLASTPPQPCSQMVRQLIVRNDKIGGGLRIGRVGRVPGAASQDGLQGNLAERRRGSTVRQWIKKVIERYTRFAAMADEGFFPMQLASPNFGEIVSESTAGDA
ncbi:MAG: hypothetical protein EXS36_09220 [Pedosphaera sp.]|nr:hypothetical protein [Pedosphaera sp.]